MKNITLCVLSAFLLLSFAPMQLNAATLNTVPANTTVNTTAPIDAAALTARLNAINATDKSSLSASEKKALRKEKRAIKGEQKHVNGGVYLSAGGIILVVILLILLL